MVALAFAELRSRPAFRRGIAVLMSGYLVALGGVSLYRNQIFSTQEGIYNDVLSFYPNDIRMLYGIYENRMNEKRYDEALELLRRIAPLDQTDMFLTNLGRTNFYLGDFERALLCFEQAILANPQNAQAHAISGEIFLQQGKLAQAEARLTRAISLDPNEAEAHRSLSRLYAGTGRGAQAQEQLRIAEELSSAKR
jgi:tetratricopeptide (TPR) repeat protein